MKKLNSKEFSFTAELAKDSDLLYDVRRSLKLRIAFLENLISDKKLSIEYYKNIGDTSYVSQLNTVLKGYQSRLEYLREFTSKLYLAF